MAMNIKDLATEQMVAELAERTGMSKTAAVREAVQARLRELDRQDGRERQGERFVRFLEEEVWPQVSPDVRGKAISKAEVEEMLGYGPGGV
jgi:antitoxin VapB